MEKHFIPILYSLVAIMGQKDVSGEDLPGNPVSKLYALLIKMIILILCLGWSVAFAMGVFTVHKVGKWVDSQEVLNKTFISEIAVAKLERGVARNQQQNNMQCLDELKHAVKNLKGGK